MLLIAPQVKTGVHRLQRPNSVVFSNNAAGADLAGCNQADVDPCICEGSEHPAGGARGRGHACPHGTDAGNRFTILERSTGPLRQQRSEGDIGAAPILLILLSGLVYLGFYIWNIFIKQGRTGYTIGKGILGIKLISEQTGQPIGAGKAFLRQLCHILDGFFYLGYLWPLWDAKKQTFADKIMTTIVINQPKARG